MSTQWASSVKTAFEFDLYKGVSKRHIHFLSSKLSVDSRTYLICLKTNAFSAQQIRKLLVSLTVHWPCWSRLRTCFFIRDTSGDTIATEINGIDWQIENCILQTSHYCPTSLFRSLLPSVYHLTDDMWVTFSYILWVSCWLPDQWICTKASSWCYEPISSIVGRSHVQPLSSSVPCTTLDWLTYYTIIDWRITQSLIDVLHNHWLT